MHACLVWSFVCFFVRFCSFLVFLIQAWQLPCTPNNNKMGSRDSESPKTPRSGSLAYQAKSKATKRSCLKHKDAPRASEVFWLLQACTHMYIHSHVHNMCIHSCMCTHVQALACAGTCICTHSHVHALTCVHTHVCTHSHVTHMCTHICIYSPTHIYLKAQV